MVIKCIFSLVPVCWGPCRIPTTCLRRRTLCSIARRLALMDSKANDVRPNNNGTDGTPVAGAAQAGMTTATGATLTAAAAANQAAGRKMNAHHRQRQRDSLRHVKYKEALGRNIKPADLIDVQVVGTGAAGSPRAVFIDMPQLRYLFNCGEGTQRVAMEQRMKLSKLDNIFVTHKTWDNVGGLLGMALSLEGIGLPKVTIHGPPGVESLLTMTRGFSHLRLIEVEKIEISSGPFEDSAMRIELIPLLATQSQEPEDPCSPASKRRRLSPDSDMTVVYICLPRQKVGTLDFMKCVELGVPRGPLLGQLKNGQAVTLDDGRVVTPDEVITPQEHTKPFIVIDIPTLGHLESLLASKEMKEYQQARRKEDEPQLVIHFTPSNIYKHPDYQQWIQGFSSVTHHLVLNEDGRQVCHEAPYSIQSQLNLIHQDVFPLLPHQAGQAEELFSCAREDSMVYGCTGLRYAIRGGTNTPTGFYCDKCFCIDNDVYTSAVLEEGSFLSCALPRTREQIQKVTCTDPSKGLFPELLFLGTGSAIPNKIRNVSGILLNLRSDQRMLLDCGEGSYSQLCHHYGNQIDTILTQLSTVFLSHLHADHHMGLFGVIHGRERAFKAAGQVAPPLTVVVTANIKPFLNNIEEYLFPVSERLRVVPVEWFMDAETEAEQKESCSQVLHNLSLTKLEFCKMRHRQYPYGIAISHMDGWKVSYSGDTMPCDNFIEIGRDSDVLIHEATMEDELEEEACVKAHSTTSQAIDIGIKMNAGFILLTHFSQRYAKVPRFNSKFTDRVGIAFDNMRVRLRDLQVLPALMPALEALFSSDLEDMEQRTMKRQMNKESRQAAHLMATMKEQARKQEQSKQEQSKQESDT